MPTTVRLRKGEVAVKVTSNVAYALSLLCAAALHDGDGPEGTEALYAALPPRDALMMASGYSGRCLDNKTITTRIKPELIPALREMLTRGMHGGWSGIDTFRRRIDDLDELPALLLLATTAV